MPPAKKKSQTLVVFTTVESKRDAKRIAQSLLEQKVAACVSIAGPVESHYRWKGKNCREPEFSLTIKTLRRTYPALSRLLAKIHPYECPEILALPAEQCWPPYEAWLREQITD